MSTSWPLRGTRRETHTTTGRSDRPCRARTSAPPQPGRKTVVSTPLGSRSMRRAEGGLEALARVGAEVGDDVDLAADPAQHLARPGQRRPADLVAVRAGDRALEAQSAGEQPERCRSAEPDPVAALGPRDPARPPQHVGGRQHQRGRVPDDRERLRRVELRRALPRRRVHHHLPRRLPHGQAVDEGLDAPRTRREVVGDDQGPHRSRSHSRARARRSVTPGWEANSA